MAPPGPRLALLGLLGGLAAWGLGLAAVSGSRAAIHDSPPSLSVDTTAFAVRPGSRMSALLEKTFLKVDVLFLEIRVDAQSAAEIEALTAGRGQEPAREDSIVASVLRTRDAWARIAFLRGASLGQFLGGVRKNLEKARRAGFIDAAYREEVLANLARWFSFLEERGVHTGDVLLYRVHEDTLRTVFLDAAGSLFLDQIEAEPRSRFAVLGSYLAPGSDFRDRLLRSLSRHAEPAPTPPGG